MEDIQKVIDLLAKDYLTDLDVERLDSFKKMVGSEYFHADDKKTYIYTETDYRNDERIKEKVAFQKQIEKIKKDALLKVIQQKYHRYYSNIIDLSTPEELAKILPDLAELKKKEEDLEDTKSGPIMFITFSPENTVGVYELIKYLEKLVKLKFVKKYLYVLEQRYNGEPNDIYKKEGDGLHSHLLIDKEVYKTSHVKRDVGRVFKNMVCNIDYKFIKEKDIDKVQTYMVGEKADDSKKVKQEYDRVWRKAMGLKNFYGDLFNDIDNIK